VTDPGGAARIIADAEHTAQSITDEFIKVVALGTVVAGALAATDPARAERIAQSITDKEKKASALVSIAKALTATCP